MRIKVKRMSTDEPNVSKRFISYDLYVDGKYVATYKEAGEALDAGEDLKSGKIRLSDIRETMKYTMKLSSIINERYILTEVLNKPYPYTMKLSETGEVIGKFKTQDDTSITFKITKYEENGEKYYGINFIRDGRYRITNEGDAFRIYATIKKMVTQWIEKVQPQKFTFDAEKNYEGKDRSRVKLYTRFASMIAKKYSYNFFIQPEVGRFISFTFEKK